LAPVVFRMSPVCAQSVDIIASPQLGAAAAYMKRR
jgi:hypothetical protein